MIKGQKSKLFGVIFLLNLLICSHQWFTQKRVFNGKSFSKTTDTMNGTILFDATNQNPASICTLKNNTSRWRLLIQLLKGEPSGSLNVPYVALQRHCDSSMPHCSSYGCSNSTGKDSINELFCYPLNRPELKQWPSGFVGIDSHRQRAEARRPVWIDLTMKTTTNSRTISSHISDIHIHTLFHDKNSDT